MGQFRPAQRQEFRFGVSQHPAHGRIHLQEVPVHPGQAHAEWSVLKGTAEALLAVAQLLPGAHALAEVADDGGNTHNLAAGILHRGDGEHDLDPAAILSHADCFVTAAAAGSGRG